MGKIKLLGLTPDEIKAIVLQEGLPKFTATQIAQWIYVKRATSFEQMTNLSKAARATLSQKYEVGLTPYIEKFESRDGTKKYLFDICAHDGRSTMAVEAVMIPSEDRATLCVSSQIGCKMACRFCMTGRQGFHGNLDAAQILSQFLAIDESDRLTNAVFMGMGEPLDNYDNVSRAIEVLTAEWGFGWSPKRITVSSIGVLPNLKRFLQESKCHLAISVHNPFSDERQSLMPAQKAWPVADVIDLIRQYDFSGQRRVSFEYTMFSGFNDTKRHEDGLIRLLRGLECRVNLIRFHQIPDFPYTTTPEPLMEAFRDRLGSHGITCTIRASRGEDIMAACGLLAGKHNKEVSDEITNS